MDEVCTCNCTGQAWKIAEDYVECCKCGKRYNIKAGDLAAKDLVRLINDNF